MNNNEIHFVIRKRIERWPEWKKNMLCYDNKMQFISVKTVEQKEIEFGKSKNEKYIVKIKK